MRLHSLTIEAFGAYAQEQTVDFDRLTRGGLFLLEGPTGAGKSTVLDAITFALYGSVAGEQSGTDRLCSQFAEPGQTPTVVLEWTARGRRMRVTRSPEYTRPKRRGTGTTVAPARVHLEERTDAGWVSRSSNKAEAADIVADLLGLNRTQFTQVALLPQGEFASFLRAGDDKRRALLTRLFGTELFDAITGELGRHREEAKAARSRAATDVERALAVTAASVGLDAPGRDQLISADLADQTRLLDELDARVAQADQAASVRAELTDTALRHAGEVLDRARLARDRAQRLERALEALAAHRSGDGEHAARLAALVRAQASAPMRARLAAFDRAAATLTQAEAEYARALAAVPPAERPTPDASADQLARRLREHGAALGALVDLEAGLPAREDELTDLRATAQEHLDQLAALREQLAAGPAELDLARGRLEAATAAAGRAPTLVAEADLAERRVELTGQLAIAVTALQTAQRAYDVAMAQARDAEAAHAQALATRWRGLAGELAEALVAGRPCPVCGSEHHPTPAPVVGAAVRQGDLDGLEQDLQAARTQVAAAEATRGSARHEVDGLLGALGPDAAGVLEDPGSALSGFEAAATLARQRAHEATRDAADQPQARQALAALTDRLAQLGEDRTRLEAACAADAARIDTLTTALSADLDRLREGADGYPDVASRVTALTVTADRLGRLADAEREWRGRAREYDDARAEAVTGAREIGHTDLDVLRREILGTEEIEELAAQVARWNARLTSLEDAVAAAHDEIATGGEVDPDPAERAARAEQAYELARQEHDEAVAARRSAQDAATGWRRARRGLADARHELAQVERSTAAAIRLAGLAHGTEGRRRTTLTTYVLRYWFAQVVDAANVHLARMSAGRYELERTDDPQDRTRRSGLTLAVVDRYTGTRRSTRSLSGGETFFTSLALALGLSQVVTAQAGGVRLDTLFIDEGFGGLDGITLDQVMDVIDELRDRGRVVGIVSHVAELKERVPERLEVRRLAGGSSTLRVVA